MTLLKDFRNFIKSITKTNIIALVSEQNILVFRGNDVAFKV